MDYRLPGTSGVACAVGAGPAVTFGDDAVAGCLLRVDSSSATSCAAVQQAAATFFADAAHPDEVGAYGNASIGNDDEWIHIRDEPPALGTCTYLEEVRLEFIFTPQGNKHNPQYRIVAARFSYLVNTVSRVPCMGSGCVPLELRAVVSFVPYDSDPEEWGLPVPPSVPHYTDDILYPFKIPRDSGASRSAGTPPRAGLLAACVLLLCVFAGSGWR
eukprot:TRINITY_DN930_c0_g2_i4.p1 TRINITY_DN930_c0_g2~~TRINITY_DN930_c0_g2_i4.p1  ORF type:complete len:215 (-),score=57.86 TRINITY_DN930_c0_g2_i4:111-755(-)